MAKRKKKKLRPTQKSEIPTRKDKSLFSKSIANSIARIKSIGNLYYPGLIYGAVPLLLFWWIYYQFSTPGQKQVLHSGEIILPILVFVYFPLAILANRYLHSPRITGFLFLISLLANLFVSLPYSFASTFESIHIYLIGLALLSGGIYLSFNPPAFQTKQSLESVRIPGFRKWLIPAWIILACVIALVLRIWNYTDYGLWVDENHHINYAYNLFNGLENDYGRAWIISRMTALMAWLGGAEEYADYIAYGRIPSIIFGALTVIPIYFLGAKLSKLTGVVSAYLWAIYPWAIGFSLYIREYSMFIFVATFAYIIFLELLQRIASFQKAQLRVIGYAVGFFIVYLFYAFQFDLHSTIRISVITLSAIGIAYLLVYSPSHVKRKKWRGVFHLVIAIAVVVTTYLCFQGEIIDRFNDSLDDVRWYEVFFMTNRDSPLHWWGTQSVSRYLTFMVIPLGVLLAFIHRNHKVYLVLSLTLLFSLLIFFYVVNHYFRPKYLSYLTPVYTVLVGGFIAGALQFVYGFLHSKLIFRRVLLLFCVVMCFLIFNIQNAITTKMNPPYQYGYLLTCGEYHYNYKYPKWVIENRVHDFHDRKKIVTVYETILKIDYGISPDDVQSFNAQDQSSVRRAFETIRTHDKGILILDIMRNQGWGRGLPIETAFQHADKKVEMIVNEHLSQIYLWDKISVEEEGRLPVYNPQ